ncbi:ATP-dependent nuclease [Pseudomonas leptonychotis]|uniref:ATP-dependent nuclease n=1 Tax=Pseudomonas leptonychotis TaxID=2448482 RepID=UPI0039EEC0E0
MKLKSLHIRNFRTLEDFKVELQGDFSSISGKNNAGKTTIIKALQQLLKDTTKQGWWGEREGIAYASAKTQWVKDSPPIEIEYSLIFSKLTDPGIYNFVIKIAEIDHDLGDEFVLKVILRHQEKEDLKQDVYLNENQLEKYVAVEIYKRIESSTLAFFHNSAEVGLNGIFSGGAMRLVQELMFSGDERKELEAEQERLKKKVKKLAGKHRAELSGLLGRLEEKYDVELTVFDRYLSGNVPLGINLKDKNLEVPLSEWGTGTQNRTHIMMSILQANKIKNDTSDLNRVSPIILIEEPESFLHPSAQAEFGRVIRSLSRDLGIQIIITTHSPYMLCQEFPESNILLDRKLFRGTPKQTEVVPVESSSWMSPFSQILGLDHESFEPWQKVIGARKDNAILVEGIIDKEYLEHISSLNIPGFSLPEGIEVLPYQGKDSLKNSILLKFVLDKFDKSLVTFDLDAHNELSRIMSNLGLTEGTDYFAVGIDEPGKNCIEGLLPPNVISAVYSKNYSLAMKSSSPNPADRKSAKNELKRLLLEEFKKQHNIGKPELSGFKKLFTAISNKFK